MSCLSPAIVWLEPFQLRLDNWLTWVSLLMLLAFCLVEIGNVSLLWLPCVFNCNVFKFPNFVSLYSTDELGLYNNNLTGTIPTEIEQMIDLGESSDVACISFSWDWECFHVVMTLCFNYMFSNILRLSYPYSTGWLELYNNSLMGDFTCPGNITYCYISCNDDTDDACRSLWSFCLGRPSKTFKGQEILSTLHFTCIYILYQWVGGSSIWVPSGIAFTLHAYFISACSCI